MESEISLDSSGRDRAGAGLVAGSIGRDKRVERKALRHAERRREILDAARKLLVQEGIDRFTIGAVARAAGVSKPAVYYYFESKEEVVAGLAEEALNAEAAAMERALANVQDPATALTVAVRTLVDHYLGDPEAFRIVKLWVESGQAVKADRRRTMEIIADHLAGVPADVTHLARIAVLGASGIVAAVLAGGAPREDAQLLCQTASCVIRRALTDWRAPELATD